MVFFYLAAYMPPAIGVEMLAAFERFLVQGAYAFGVGPSCSDSRLGLSFFRMRGRTIEAPRSGGVDLDQIVLHF